MNIIISKGEAGPMVRFEKPHKLRDLNIMQLRKVYRRALKYSAGLAAQVQAEVDRRIDSKKKVEIEEKVLTNA
jgi:hypothetical protein